MNPENRIVIRIPVEKLWNDQTELDLERVSYLSKMELLQMLRNGQVQFVLADIGKKLMWMINQAAIVFGKPRSNLISLTTPQGSFYINSPINMPI